MAEEEWCVQAQAHIGDGAEGTDSWATVAVVFASHVLHEARGNHYDILRDGRHGFDGQIDHATKRHLQPIAVRVQWQRASARVITSGHWKSLVMLKNVSVASRVPNVSP